MRVLRAIGWAVSVVWAVLWGALGVSLVGDPTYDWDWSVDPFILCFFLLPSVLFWVSQVRRTRRQRRGVRVADAPPAAERVAPPTAEPSDDELAWPAPIRDEWRRLEHARDLAVGFADDGWIERAALLHVDDHMARLRRLLDADVRTNRLGGASSTTVQRQVEELRALLVALADEAVEHQASLVGDDPAPATLADARDRLAASTQAYRELQQPDESRRLQRPGSAGTPSAL